MTVAPLDVQTQQFSATGLLYTVQVLTSEVRIVINGALQDPPGAVAPAIPLWVQLTRRPDHSVHDEYVIDPVSGEVRAHFNFHGGSIDRDSSLLRDCRPALQDACSRTTEAKAAYLLDAVIRVL